MIQHQHQKLRWKDALAYFAYPFRGGGKFVFAFGAVLMLIARILIAKSITNIESIGFRGSIGGLQGAIYGIIAICIYGYMSLSVMSVVSRTACGDPEVPDWPDVRSWGEAAGGAFILGGTLAISYAPLIAYHLVSNRHDLWFWILACLGTFYCPMALLSVAIHDDLNGVNPITVMCGIARTFPAYLAVLWIVPAVWYLDSFVGTSLLVSAAVAIITTYCLLIGGRHLGLFYRRHARRLDWWPDDGK